MFTPQASHICPSPGVSSTFIILPCGRRPPSSLRRMTKRITSRSIKSHLSNPGTPTPIGPLSRCDRRRPSRRHHPRPPWGCQPTRTAPACCCGFARCSMPSYDRPLHALRTNFRRSVAVGYTAWNDSLCIGMPLGRYERHYLTLPGPSLLRSFWGRLNDTDLGNNHNRPFTRWLRQALLGGVRSWLRRVPDRQRPVYSGGQDQIRGL